MIWLLFALIAVYTALRPSIWPWLALLAFVLLLARLSKRPKIEFVRHLSTSHTFIGAEVEVRLCIKISASWPVLLTINEKSPLTLIADRQIGLSGLFFGQSQHQLIYRITPKVRGGFIWPEPDISWSDPLAFFQREYRTALPNKSQSAELIVYPAIHQLALPNLLKPLLADGAPARQMGLEDPTTLAGLRPYVPGDPSKRIHWRQTARQNRLIVRQFEQVASTGLVVHLDLNKNEVYGENALSLAASFIKTAFDEGLGVGLSGLGPLFFAHGFTALQNCLQRLALAKIDQPEIFHQLDELPSGTNLVIISQTVPNELLEAAIKARAKAARVFLLALPEGFYLAPGERGRPLHSGPPSAIRQLENKAGLLKEAGINVVILRGDESILKLSLVS